MKLLLIFCLFFVSCAYQKPVLGEDVKLNFLDEYSIPLNTISRGTVVGGLSGIDRDAGKDKYVLISDDGSKISPARFYSSTIRIKRFAFDTLIMEEVHFILTPGGDTFSTNRADPESIRRRGNEYWWSTEPEMSTTLLRPSWIRSMNRKGEFRDSLPIPRSIQIGDSSSGMRSNEGIEGLCFKGNSLIATIEAPVIQDGPKATYQKGAPVRWLLYDMNKKTFSGEYIYELDPVAYPPQPSGTFSINGITDILETGGEKFLVIERSYSTGRKGCVVKVFLATIRGGFSQKVEKRLLLNMESLPITVYNIEGVCWGPRLPNGNATLIFVADDNFSANDKTQFLLFEVVQGIK